MDNAFIDLLFQDRFVEVLKVGAACLDILGRSRSFPASQDSFYYAAVAVASRASAVR